MFSNKLDLINRLVNRYKLTFTPENPTFRVPFADIILPVTQYDDLARTPTPNSGSGVDPGGTGWYTFVTVSAGQSWRLHSYHLERTNGATLTFNKLAVSNGTITVPIVFGNAAAEIGGTLPHPLVIPENWLIRAYANAYNAGDQFGWELLYDVEESYL